MKVLLVGDYPPPYGGVSVHVAALLERALARGIPARVLDIGAGGRAGHRQRGPVLPSGGHARFASLLAAHAAGGWTLHVHTSGANRKSWLLAAGVAAVARGRAVLTLHSGLTPAFLAAHRVARRAAQLASRGYRRILCANTELASALARAGVQAERVRVAPAFTPSLVKPGAPPLVARAHRVQHRPLVCAAVGPTPTYGTAVLLEAFARLRERLPFAGLCLYGDGTDAIALRDRVHWQKLDGAVALLGPLEHERALGLVDLCDLFVRPTLADGDALTVREALALGRRVVATAVGHRPPGIELCAPGDSASLAGAMVRALQQEPPRPRCEPGIDGVEAAIATYEEVAHA